MLLKLLCLFYCVNCACLFCCGESIHNWLKYKPLRLSKWLVWQTLKVTASQQAASKYTHVILRTHRTSLIWQNICEFFFCTASTYECELVLMFEFSWHSAITSIDFVVELRFFTFHQTFDVKSINNCSTSDNRVKQNIINSRNNNRSILDRFIIFAFFFLDVVNSIIQYHFQCTKYLSIKKQSFRRVFCCWMTEVSEINWVVNS